MEEVEGKQSQAAPASANHWPTAMDNRYIRNCGILFGVCMMVAIVVFTLILLLPIIITQSKYTTTETSITVTTKITANSTSTTTTSTTSTSISTTTTSISTTTSSASTTTTTTSSTSQTTSTTTVTTTAQLALISIDGIIHGVFNTIVGGNSSASTAGFNVGNYPTDESPADACDRNISTKYLNFGSCSELQILHMCGLNTGFYLELLQGPALVTGLQVCTADDSPERDPLTVTLEGSNQSGTALTVGTSWSLIYSGKTGLLSNPGRDICGIVQSFNNSIQYKSYRFLVSSKRAMSNSVQYSELQLFN